MIVVVFVTMVADCITDHCQIQTNSYGHISMGYKIEASKYIDYIYYHGNIMGGESLIHHEQ